MQSSEPSSVDASSPLDPATEERKTFRDAAANARSVLMLTGTHGVVSPPIDEPRVALPLPRELGHAAEGFPDDDALSALLRARAAQCQSAGDRVGELRARLELARAKLATGDREAARTEAAAAALVTEHAPAARAMLRALSMRRDLAEEQLVQVDALIAASTSERERADWLAERARLLEEGKKPTPESIAAWNAALAIAGTHAGALYGAEAALDASGAWDDLAAHLAVLASIVDDRDLAAWLEVERALLLDRKLSQKDAAGAALMKALELAPGIGPVRDASVDFAVRHRDDARLARLLAEESAIEPDAARAARLELDAALAHLRARGDAGSAMKLLERGEARAPTTPLVDLKIAETLARLAEAAGSHALVHRMRKAALRTASDPREELVLLRALAASAERAGELDDAVLALERARVLEPDDATLLADLDRLLAAVGRNEQRAVVWMREAATYEEPARKARALLRAADASKAAGRTAEAARHLQSAWVSAPGVPGVYDALAERLAPVAATPAVAPRVQLYEQALRATRDPEKRIYYLEKIAWLWDDVAGDATAAMRAYEEVLAIEPARASAIAGLASAASRAGDMKALARSLLAEADVTGDPQVRAELRLRGAEALAGVDAERALALAQQLREEGSVSSRAAELVTRLHAEAERWELVARTLEERGRVAAGTNRISLLLAEVDVLLDRLHAPERALAAIERVRAEAGNDPALDRATITTLESLGDESRLRSDLERLAISATTPVARAQLLVRAAEIDEREDRDETAAALYLRAREELPDEPLIADRLARLGARTDVEVPLPDIRAAVRALDSDRAQRVTAEALLATSSNDAATIRLAERLARRARSAPHLANALSLAAESTSGVAALRALEGLASLVLWRLPPAGEDLSPWDKMLALGTNDAAALDTLIARASSRVRDGDARAIELTVYATKRRLENATDTTEQLLLVLDLARLARRTGDLKSAARDAHRALLVDAASVSAACLLWELASELGDRNAGIVAIKSLAELTVDGRAKAALLRDAADLCAASSDRQGAASLLERALEADPDAVLVAARLAELQIALGNFSDLTRVLRRALRHATTPDAIIPMASELAEVARNKLKDPLLAIEALERARAADATHVPTLFLLAELYIGQRAWQDALGALASIASTTEESSEKLVALFGRASINQRVLANKQAAEKDLRTVLEIDPNEPRALRTLLDIGTHTSDERLELLSRLSASTMDPAERQKALLEVAETRRLLADATGAESALVEAASIAPDATMISRLRAAAGDDLETLARVLSRVVARAMDAGKTPDAALFIALGEVESKLGRVDQAVDRFIRAVRIDPSRDEARVALGRALIGRGKHEDAVAALLPLLDAPNRRVPLDVACIRLLESALSGAGRPQQAHVARELRAIAGDLDAPALAKLDAARPVSAAETEPLSAAALRSYVVPGGLGKHPIWDVARLAAGFSGKLARVSLQDQGATTRDRVKAKAVHPLRQMFDRLLAVLELQDVELAVSEVAPQVAVACEDVTWVVVPAAVAGWAEPHAVAALARPLVRISLGIPWLGPLAPHEVLALLVGFARQAASSFGAKPIERVEPLVGDYEQRARKAIDRKRRKQLEEIEPALRSANAVDDVTFADAALRAEVRGAFLLSASLRAALDSLAAQDPALEHAIRVPDARALAAVVGKPVARDAASYALSGEATALRRTLGTLYT